MIKIAAIGDLHYSDEVSEDLHARLCPDWQSLHESADVLLLAGDLTKRGYTSQVELLIDDLRCVGVPIVAVLGNHEYHNDQQEDIRRALERAGVTVLEGETTTLTLNGETLGIAGIKGFGGGFVGACAHAVGEPEMKAFALHTERVAARLEEELGRLRTDYKVALLHYAPVEATLRGERLELFPFLGSYLLAQAIDSVGADLAIHGHAHAGQENGVTEGGVPVRNVALPVLRRAYALYTLGGGEVTSSPE